MKRSKKVRIVVITVLFVLMGLYSSGWTWDTMSKDDPITDEWNMFDLLVARPVGIAAWLIGSGVFVLTLPFTIPTGSTSDAAQMFVVDPFKFSFERKFPDENLHMDDIR